VTITGLSFSAATTGFNVYRGSNPIELLRIAENASTASTFIDAGADPEGAEAADGADADGDADPKGTGGGKGTSADASGTHNGKGADAPAPMELIRFVCFSAGDLAVYEALLAPA
jgi:hypothetical protein